MINEGNFLTLDLCVLDRRTGKITKIDHMYDTRSRETIGVLVYPKIFQGTICITDLWYLWILNGYPRYFVISRMYRAPVVSRTYHDHDTPGLLDVPWYSVIPILSNSQRFHVFVATLSTMLTMGFVDQRKVACINEGLIEVSGARFSTIFVI